MRSVELAILLVVVVLPEIALSWDLSVLKISPTYYASSVAIYKNRAFLALPRSSCFNNVSNPTLVEVPWHNEGKYGVFRKKMYPNYKEQKWGACKDHQDAVSVDVEVKRAKLWVLDRGSKKCLPKIVIYNLHYNTIGQNTKLVNVPGEKLSSLVVDPESDEFGTKAYIGGFDNYILAYSSRSLKTWKIVFSRSYELPAPISTSSLALSMTQPLLYLAGMDDFNLHAINLTMIRQYYDISLYPRDVVLEVNVTSIGEKLGPSSGMIADWKHGLHYYLTRDYAVVRWNTSMPLVAENHEVLMQTYEMLPYVSAMFRGPKNTIWALVNPAKSETCNHRSRTSRSIYKGLPLVKKRTVKIWQKN